MHHVAVDNGVELGIGYGGKRIRGQAGMKCQLRLQDSSCGAISSRA